MRKICRKKITESTNSMRKQRQTKNISKTSRTQNLQMTRSEIHPHTKTERNTIYLLKDFDQFVRRMRLQYLYHGENNEPHRFHIKSGWTPPVQHSVALESSLEEFYLQKSNFQSLKMICLIMNKENLKRLEKTLK